MAIADCLIFRIKNGDRFLKKYELIFANFARKTPGSKLL
jgi:hypothetical protein